MAVKVHIYPENPSVLGEEIELVGDNVSFLNDESYGQLFKQTREGDLRSEIYIWPRNIMAVKVEQI